MGSPVPENGRARVVITGIGAVTPLGSDFESSWGALIAGENGVGPITHFDASAFPFASPAS